MKDSDLIEAIRGIDGEIFKKSLIEELNNQEYLSRLTMYAEWWNGFRSCLAAAVRRAGAEIPS